uniref:Uncharacterized protein n=1 Tax=Anopheles melas TaxID=34690 RepID=A0A182TUV8_9DIPT
MSSVLTGPASGQSRDRRHSGSHPGAAVSVPGAGQAHCRLVVVVVVVVVVAAVAAHCTRAAGRRGLAEAHCRRGRVGARDTPVLVGRRRAVAVVAAVGQVRTVLLAGRRLDGAAAAAVVRDRPGPADRTLGAAVVAEAEEVRDALVEGVRRLGAAVVAEEVRDALAEEAHTLGAAEAEGAVVGRDALVAEGRTIAGAAVRTLDVVAVAEVAAVRDALVAEGRTTAGAVGRTIAGAAVRTLGLAVVRRPEEAAAERDVPVVGRRRAEEVAVDPIKRRVLAGERDEEDNLCSRNVGLAVRPSITSDDVER